MARQVVREAARDPEAGELFFREPRDRGAVFEKDGRREVDLGSHAPDQRVVREVTVHVVRAEGQLPLVSEAQGLVDGAVQAVGDGTGEVEPGRARALLLL